MNAVFNLYLILLLGGGACFSHLPWDPKTVVGNVSENDLCYRFLLDILQKLMKSLMTFLTAREPQLSECFTSILVMR